MLPNDNMTFSAITCKDRCDEQTGVHPPREDSRQGRVATAPKAIIVPAETSAIPIHPQDTTSTTERITTPQEQSQADLAPEAMETVPLSTRWIR